MQYLKENNTTTIEWDAPSGVHVVQRYVKQKRKRIKNVLGQSLHSYRLDIDKVDRRRHANAFAANFLHSIDASLLCHGLSHMREQGINSVLSIHDCFGVHAAVAGKAHHIMKDAYIWAVDTGREAIREFGERHDFDPGPCYDASSVVPHDPSGLSGYLFS